MCFCGLGEACNEYACMWGRCMLCQDWKSGVSLQWKPALKSALLPPWRAQELVCSADQDVEAVLAYRSALEQALDAPAAAHPVEGYGPDNMSLAQVIHACVGPCGGRQRCHCCP